MLNILIRGARTHNLKNIDVTMPRDKLIVITGLSGSGKSSLAFDTLYAEGQRRYVESLSAYARQFLSMMEKPDVDHIEGLSPAISIEQKSTSHNPRSTVGTVTEIYDYLRVLYARVGEPRCPKHQITLEAQTISQMVDAVLALPDETKIMILAPVVRERKGEYRDLIDQLKAQGFVRARIDGKVIELEDFEPLAKNFKHTIEVVVDRIKVKPDARLRLAESFEIALRLGNGLAAVGFIDQPKKEEWLFSNKFACPECGYSLAELEPRLFSFNNPNGACPECDGLGIKLKFDPEKVVVAPEKSLADGAIRGWDQNTSYYFGMLKTLAKHYKFSVDEAFCDLPKKIQNLILYGNNGDLLKFTFVNDRGQRHESVRAFEGVIPNFERRYHATDSQMMRDEFSKLLSSQPCQACHGQRLNEAARNIFVQNLSLPSFTNFSIEEAIAWLDKLKLTGRRKEIADKINKEIRDRLSFLMNVGLDYLTLDRSADTLSGGEAQRIRLASQIGAGLVGVMYILDEPSIGLHQRDNDRLLKTLFHLRDLGNTVIVVEHDEDAIRHADHIIDIGPAAGVHGGQIIAQGNLKEILKTKGSLTAQYLNGTRKIEVPKERMPATNKKIHIKGAKGNNLKNVSVDIPVGLMTCVTGVSGSGKSTLINDTLYPIAAKKLNGGCDQDPAPYAGVQGLEHLDKVIDIDQSPIGRTPRSNPATYTGMFTAIRELFAQTPEARSRGYSPGRFSFNVKGGRCEACEGDGVIKVEMHFLADVYVTCDVCHGQRYNRETLEVFYKGKNIHQVLNMTVEDALEFFKAVPAIAKKCQTLMDVGLSYICLGQSATTLSGGEAQRVKLSKELSKRGAGKTLYILDEPTTGLHFYDIEQLLGVLHRLRDQGNTIVIIEHNLDVIKTADWIIDLGPEGGSKGGTILVAGTPEAVAKHKQSYTGQFLKKML
ncbi:MAG: UvrABC system protein [Gammaproteobacteria bacterium]|jgi:excinuclease ABC subunit A|nr:UvrABC system protein [Gammaproteobacteria bacterium]